MNLVEYFVMRKAQIDARLDDIESGRVSRVTDDTALGSSDVTEQEKKRLRQVSHVLARRRESATHQFKSEIKH